jgi:hypothetical protein
MRSLQFALSSFSIVILLSASSAWAGDTVSAEAVFQAGREAAVRGDYREACAKFAESQRLDPAPGTLINLGDCKEHLGLFASAWGYYREAADRLTGDKRVQGLEARMAAIAPRLSRLTLTLAPGAPAETRITRDDVELGAASLGVAMPIDPGDHLIVVTAPKREPKRYSVTIVEAKAQVIQLSPGEATPSSVAPSPTPLLPAPATGSGAGPGRVAGFVIGSLGIAGLVASGVTGVMTLQRKSAVEVDCPQQRCHTGAGLEAASQGKTLSLVSTVAFATGLVGVGVGVYLVVASSPRAAPAVVALGPMIGPGNTGLQLQGQF